LKAKWGVELSFVLLVFTSADEADDYYTAGMAMAVSLVHEGPAPAFLSKELFAAVTGDPTKVTVELSTLPEGPMKADLIHVRHVCYSQSPYPHNVVL